MNKSNIIGISIIMLLLIVFFCLRPMHENFDNNPNSNPNNNSNNTDEAENNNNKNNEKEEETGNNSNSENKNSENEGNADLVEIEIENNDPEHHLNIGLLNQSHLLSSLNNINNQVSDKISDDIEEDEELSLPTVTTDIIGSTRMILYWKKEDNPNLSVDRYVVKVYECPNKDGNPDKCEDVSKLKVVPTDHINPSCQNCYLMVSGLDMAKNTYIITLQIVYLDKINNNLIKTKESKHQTGLEVDQGLDKVYQTALDHLIKENINRKKLDMSQGQQKIKIINLQNKISALKQKLFRNKDYQGRLEGVRGRPYPIEIKMDATNVLDYDKVPQQTIKIDGKEYYLGISH